MSAPRPKTPRRAILVRRQEVDIRDVSRGGCRLVGAQPLAVGAVGVLAVDIEGERHVEVFRVTRSQPLAADAPHYEAGLEFLPVPAETPSLHDVVAQLDQAE